MRNALKSPRLWEVASSVLLILTLGALAARVINAQLSTRRLIEAVARGDRAGALRHVLEGGDCNARTPWNSVLTLAIADGDETLFRSALMHGAQVNVPDSIGNYPLNMAAGHGKREFALVLIRSGADVNSQSAGGNTPLAWAVLSNDRQLIRELLSRGANPEIANDDGRTPIDLARLMGEPSTIVMLPQKKIEPFEKQMW